MAYYMSPIESTLSSDDSYDAYANLQVGSNGDPSGDPTSAIGDVYGEENWAYNTWDTNVSGGFDTSNVPITFDVTSDGSETLNVGNNSPLTNQTDSIGPISSVVIEAAVQTNATAKWGGISVEFLKNGSVVETDTFASGPQVDTTTSGASNVADQTLTVTPSAPDDDEVIVTGIMRMTSPGISYPAAQAMFCNVFVKGANATTGGSGGGVGIGFGGGDDSGG
jgi:hypothetical protein